MNFSLAKSWGKNAKRFRNLINLLFVHTLNIFESKNKLSLESWCLVHS